MEGLNSFKKEFKNKAIDFASTYHILKEGGSRTPKEKKETIEEAYAKLEKWVLERFNTWLLDKPEKSVIGVDMATGKDESVEIEWPDESDATFGVPDEEKEHDPDLDF